MIVFRFWLGGRIEHYNHVEELSKAYDGKESLDICMVLAIIPFALSFAQP